MMGITSATNALELRRELALRNRAWARGRLHVESYGEDPVIVYRAEECGHGNFFDPAYAAIQARPEWRKRFDKVHAQARHLPRIMDEPGAKWRELDSCMSSDALLMNVFCTPGVVESSTVRNALGVDAAEPPVFGWKPRVPLKSGRMDRTEVDMRWGALLVEAKLTEADFQTKPAALAEAYRDFDEVFDRDLLPVIEVPLARRKSAIEFPEEFTQEWEDTSAPNDEAAAISTEYQALIAAREAERIPTQKAYQGYQLIRNVLAAHAAGASFCVIYDERRPDLREAWFRVMQAVRSASMRVRLKALTWQELAVLLPEALQDFLDSKYGIVAPGRVASVPGLQGEAGEE